MSCFSNGAASNLYENCCKGSCLCSFDGDLDCVMTAPIYVQQVFDAVKFNLQGMKTFNDQAFSPCLPQGSRIKRVIDIRCKKAFNPNNIDDPCNLTLKSDTSISGSCASNHPENALIRDALANSPFSSPPIPSHKTARSTG